MISVLTHRDYKRFLRELIKEQARRGSKAELAQAAGCQRAFFSQVLHGNAHLTLDHAMGIASHLRLSPLEADYFYCLVGHARAGTRVLREHYETRMKAMAASSRNLTARFKQGLPSKAKDLCEYYSSWKYAAVHMLTTIPAYGALKAIASRLRVPEPEIESTLQKLEEWGLCARRGGGWKALETSIHLPKDHFMNLVNHRNWRHRNLQAFENHPDSSLSYSSVYTLSHEDAEKLKEKILAFIDETRQLVLSSTEEDAFSFTLDLVRL
jgi:uncharacterized protein (TIGR02147 family)